MAEPFTLRCREVASAHLLAGISGDGFLEVDGKANPLRNDFCGTVGYVRDGLITLSDEPGRGFVPDIDTTAS